MSNSSTDYQLESRQGSIVVVDNELLSQDCLAEAIRGEFPQMRVIGTPTICNLLQSKKVAVEAVLIRIYSHPSDMTHDIRAVSQYFTHAPVIVISPREDISSVEAAAAAGARGLIPVTASLKIAAAALRLVLAGGTYHPHQFYSKFDTNDATLEIKYESTAGSNANFLLRTGLSKDLPLPQVEFEDEKETNGFRAAFTNREIHVLTALRQGRSNKWIAHHLNLSENTVKVHVRHIMRKLNATNRTEAVVLSQSLVASGG